MFVLDTESIPWEPVTANTRTGKISRKFLRENELAEGIGYTTDLVYYHKSDEAFTAPRHRHDFAQFRVTLSGLTDYGFEQVAEGGDVTYFPAGAYYGPETIEEAEILLIQWSRGWVTREKSNRAFEELAKKGTFKDGYYHTTDTKGRPVRRDGNMAVWETVTGTPLTIPSPKYGQPIVMKTSGYDWSATESGLAVKDLGHFTDEDVNVQAVKWKPGQEIELGSERTTLVWVASGELSSEGQNLTARSVMFSDFGDTHTLTGVEDGEALLLRLPIVEPGA
ncbi:hypothetical protein CJ179_01255 [Rhodococcus sp. ACS1]|uniref:hypothetical protein n=1 Tax=Rhodococcus sp. ACS1 TaxID=2028570 RepID=UPI000BB106F9|nr:hypothetical protein [Rhodococcus sp. ACS1]PBC52059.1 hypothetical protein CJ179_01255 [Rhodococcus sp. ACS1]